VSARVKVNPDPFTLIAYDPAEIAAIVEDVAALTGFPPDVEIRLDVDEELFAPLVGQFSDVVDGRAQLWFSGANFEDNRRPRHFSAEQARRDLTIALLRANDRLSDDFAEAPPDAQLTRGERAAWDVYAVGRAGRLGMPVRRQAQLYEYRLQHGFTDVADAAFERLWNAPSTTFAAIQEICAETGAGARSESKIAIDLLRQR
jgi:hypothetical protein